MSDAQAQPITAPEETTVLNRIVRTRESLTSASIVIKEGTHAICVKSLMTDPEASLELNQFLWVLQISNDDFVTMVPGAGTREQWRGGAFIHKQTGLETPNHVLTCWANSDLQAGRYQGYRARIYLDLPMTITVGFRLRLNPEGVGTPE